jgi:hypothetical protein
MYENGKMRPVETISEMGEGLIKEKDGGSKYNCDMFKNFCQCHYVPPVQE